jgi:hypothetical protein
VLDCSGLARPTAATIDQLARLHLAERRRECRVELAGAQPCLAGLIDLCGLSGVLGLESGREAEEREHPGGVEEEGDLHDAPA